MSICYMFEFAGFQFEEASNANHLMPEVHSAQTPVAGFCEVVHVVCMP